MTLIPSTTWKSSILELNLFSSMSLGWICAPIRTFEIWLKFRFNLVIYIARDFLQELHSYFTIFILSLIVYYPNFIVSRFQQVLCFFPRYFYHFKTENFLFHIRLQSFNFHAYNRLCFRIQSGIIRERSHIITSYVTI